MFCVKCGAEINNGEKVCRSCGVLQDGAMFCKHCGEAIDKDCIICPKCGKQVGEVKTEQPNIVINNSNNNTNTAHAYASAGIGYGRMKNKWVAFVLCFCFGVLGVHKFYEGKIGMGILYIITFGLFGIGWFVDLIAILLKPNPYYV